jgi:hypothetical protein
LPAPESVHRSLGHIRRGADFQGKPRAAQALSMTLAAS